MQTSIQSIFSNYTKGKSIFVNKDALSTSYMPGSVTHRDEPMNNIANILAPCLRGERPSNIFAYGKTGTGKTLCVNYVVGELLKNTGQNGSIRTVAVNCKMRKIADTEYRLVAQLCKELGKQVPATGLPTSKIYEIFNDLLDGKKQNVILVLDEIDTLIKKAGDEILYNLTRINQELKQAKLTIIGITNNLSFAEGLDPRVKSSLSEEEVFFKPYDALELRDILQQRSQIAFARGALSEGVVEKCSALAAQEHGDARRALDLLRVAGEIAERNNETAITEKHVDLAQDKINLDKIMEAVRTQPKQSQAVLWSAIKIMEVKKEIATGEVYEQYKKVCKKRGLASLGQRRVSDLITELGMLGILNTKIISKGRYGRTKEIKPAVPAQLLDDIKTVLGKDFYFE
ncbi:MAG: orc1/cdc6 family replication initiation protein [Candidatus Aenigmatarchaeota archaeon]